MKDSTRPGTTDYNSRAAAHRLKNIVLKQRAMFEKMQKSGYINPNTNGTDESP